MRQQQSPWSARDRRKRTVIVILIFLLVTGALSTLVAEAIATLTATANSIDDHRALDAASAAEMSLRKQIGGTVRDNGYWDDAYQHVAVRNDIDWAIENWGKITRDYPLYDTAIVIGPNDEPLIAFYKGDPIEESPSAFFEQSFKTLLAEARAAALDRDRLPVHFIRTRQGIAVVGVSPIQLVDGAATVPKTHVLVFAKHMDRDVTREVAANFGLTGLSLRQSPDSGQLHSPLLNADQQPVAYFSWDAQAPGSKSLATVAPLLFIASIGVLLFLGGIVAVGGAAIRNLSRDEALARYRSLHDPLTGLLNRAGLSERFNARRDSDRTRSMTLNLIDLDGFKTVNDLWGHPVGDALIVAVAQRIRSAVADTALVARLGGDEFAVVEIVNADDALRIGQELQQALVEPFSVEGRVIEIGASVGVVHCDKAEESLHELMRRADIALYRAKEAGRNTVLRYTEALDVRQAREATLEQDLREALDRQAIDVVFQPLVDAETGALRGVEALARWTSAEHNVVPPDVFIPLAEHVGLIDRLGLQVMEKALKTVREWPGMALSVNASPIQLRNPYFVEQVRQLVSGTSFDFRRLTIEITEGVLISNPDQAERAILGLKALGIKVSLDDFGSGYASIGALRKFRFDRVKIDRSLIIALDEMEEGVGVLHATISLANALNIPVTAEGIETEQQALAARRAGCDQLQGYLFSKPLAAVDISARYFASEAMSSNYRR